MTVRRGASDNFLALGGDSLRATQVLSRVRSLFSVNLSIATLFFKATVAQLAEEIAGSTEALDHNSKATILAELTALSNVQSIFTLPLK
jgi:hypothetical protein